MPQLSGTRLFVLVHSLVLCIPAVSRAQSVQTVEPSQAIQASQTENLWSVAQAEHIYGLPDIKAHKKGTLTLSGDELTFTRKAGRVAIPRSSITAVSAGNQRVEMWGIYGRIMRMAIPDNGGLAVAAVAHHRIDMLTVDFTDSLGGSHSAVFFLGANKAAQALQSFALAPKTHRAIVGPDCDNTRTEPGSMLIVEPDWNGAQVPAAYQGLVYEHLTDRFREAKNVTKIYREGESIPDGVCPQYKVHLSITGFKEGSSVTRTMFGPMGMFVGTTQMVFDAELSDRAGRLVIKEQVKTTIRGENESTNVADHVAKTLVKKYEKAFKAAEKKARKQAEVAKV